MRRPLTEPPAHHQHTPPSQQAKAALGASTSSLGSVCTTASVASAPAAGLLAAPAAPITTSGPAAAPPPPPPILYAQLSSASSNLSLDELALTAHDYDEEDPMSPQSVFPRVRQKLREEAAANAGGGVLAGAGVVDADQSGDHLSLSLPSPVAVAAAAAATKKRCGRQLPEIPQTVRAWMNRSLFLLVGQSTHMDRPTHLRSPFPRGK